MVRWGMGAAEGGGAAWGVPLTERRDCKLGGADGQLVGAAAAGETPPCSVYSKATQSHLHQVDKMHTWEIHCGFPSKFALCFKELEANLLPLLRTIFFFFFSLGRRTTGRSWRTLLRARGGGD